MLSNNLSLVDIVKEIFGDINISFNQNYSCSYKCNCSRDRMRNNLITLGEKEIKEIIDEKGEAQLQCYFCNTYYQFDTNQLIELYKIAKS
jgi:molecular chaperone Hsp33